MLTSPLAPSPHHPCGEPPAPGEATEVAPGIFWLRMPLPFKLDHINLWMIEDDGGFTLVDSGIDLPEVRAAWERLFAGALAHRPAIRLVCTHFHPDHLGLAGWLCATRGLDLWATHGEWSFGRLLALEDDAEVTARALPFYRSAGFDEAMLQMVAARGNVYRRRIAPVPATFRRLRDGDRLVIGGRSWEVIVASGHSPEHASLWCDDLRVLIAGDQVLPRISPNISVWPNEPEADPLALYLESLGQFRRLPDDALVLPSHHEPFVGLPARIDQLAAHHDQRLDATLAACRTPSTAVDVLRRLFRRPLDDHQLFFAAGEALAHLRYLEGRALVVRERDGNPVLWSARS